MKYISRHDPRHTLFLLVQHKGEEFCHEQLVLTEEVFLFTSTISQLKFPHKIPNLLDYTHQGSYTI